jgi:hypothetical protein
MMQNVLEELVGAQLSAVTVVMDYAQIVFDGATLTAFTCPAVEANSRTLRSTDVGYRDALCARIGRTVVSAHVSDELISLGFDDGAVITISLRAEDLEGVSAESAHFEGRDARRIVFRPGD